MILREFHLTNMLNCWFSKMDICVPLDLLATGNTVGEVESDNVRCILTCVGSFVYVK